MEKSTTKHWYGDSLMAKGKSNIELKSKFRYSE